MEKIGHTLIHPLHIYGYKMIKNEKELEKHFVKIRKAHWLDYEKYTNKKIIPYLKETTPNLINSKNKDILDMGAGPGHYTYALMKLGHKVKGIDCIIKDDTISSYKFLSDKYKLGHIYVGAENAYLKDNFGFENKFDIINFRGALFHIIDTIYKKEGDDGVYALFERLKLSLKDKDSVVIFALNIKSMPTCIKYLKSQKYLKIKEIKNGVFIGQL
jgi:SAM-dependent methyltransferase